MTKTVNVKGVGPLYFPDEMNDEQIAAAIMSNMPSLPKAEAGAAPMSTGEDVTRSAGRGLAKGALDIATVPMGPLHGAVEGARRFGVQGARHLGYEVPPLLEQSLPPPAELLQKGIELHTGKWGKPQTPVGRYAEPIGHMSVGALAGPMGAARSVPQIAGHLARRELQYGVVPGAGSEYARSKFEGTPYEGAAGVAGALLGVGAGAAGGAGYSAAKNRVAAAMAGRGASDIVGAPVGAGAIRRLAGDVETDRITPASAAARQAELGDEGMLLDIGRQVGSRAEALSAQPGRQQNVILDAVEGRTGRFGEGTVQRIEQTLNQEMGPSLNKVELTEGVAATVDRISGPLYRQVMAAHPVVDVPTNITQRPAIAEAMRNARGLAANYGETIDVTARPSLRAWDYVKKDLDRRVSSYYKSGGASELNSADKADLGGLQDARRALVGHLDAVTNGAYAQARQVASAKPELREAYDFGRSVFNPRLLPEEAVAEVAEMSTPARWMAQQGMRRELDRLIHVVQNEGATARNKINVDYTLKKVATFFGPQAAREVERRIGAEVIFQETTQKIAQNSRTATRLEKMKDTTTPSATELRSTGLTGLGLAGARGGLNYLRQHGMANTREQLGEMLTARGPQINPLLEELLRYNTRKAGNVAPAGSANTALINAIISGQ